ncbi:cyclophilin-like fold protein [Alcanivorax sp. S6407]|uniref:cyclophilin-like fold protein n=1 Tax=Alcanivorax sp. S6407 TaxID=2926424 RepID=UPI001FF5A796|nr:cyclophilin-like fold protein [Alcanivorax sp. S6407]MCK0154826.1 cyclophilin-like fold protein [Alcanivorax sp. S6407]
MRAQWFNRMCFIGLLLVAVQGLAEAPQQQKGQPMHFLSITFDTGVLTAELDDSAASRDFLALLPLTLELDDHAATEKVADLPARLSTAEAPAGFDPSVGDITYYAPWGNLAIFYKDFGYARGLVPLGRITGGLELLNFHGKKTVTIEQVSSR